MKKLLFVAVLGVFVLASCSKKKDCECVQKLDGVALSTTTTTIEDGECADMNSSVTAGTSTQTMTCTEK